MSRTFTRAVTVTVAALVASAATAAAVDASVSLTSPDDVALDGAFSALFDGGAVRVRDTTATGDVLFLNATGLLSVSTWRVLRVSDTPEVPLTASDAETVEHELVDARLTLRLAGEGFGLSALAPAATAFTITGDVAGAGLPTRLPESMPDAIVFPASPWERPPEVVAAWEAEWPYLSHDYPFAVAGSQPGVAETTRLQGFPTVPDARLGVSGDIAFQIAGGNLTVATRDGTTEWCLGHWSEPSADGADSGREETWRRVVFRGTLGGADVPLGSAESALWLVGGSAARWTLDGSAAWTRATGSVTGPTGSTSFDAATVTALGTFDVTPDLGAVAGSGVTDVTYRASGDFEAFTVDGASTLGAARSVPVALVASASLLTLLAAFLFEAPRDLAWRFLAAGYTRLAARELLDHPQRRRIHDTVVAQPGIHLRELNRVTGGGWGTFRVHLRLLRDGGYLRVEKQGRYALVYATSTPRAAVDPGIPHPLARAAFAALPSDGSAVPLRDLRQQLDTSRQLLNYHVGRLAASGLVVVADTEAGRTVARRNADGPAAAESSATAAKSGA